MLEKLQKETEGCSFAPERVTKHKDKKFKLLAERSADHFEKLYNDRNRTATATQESKPEGDDQSTTSKEAALKNGTT